MKRWTRETAIKTLKTMAQAAIGAIGSTAMITEVNWGVVAATAALSGLMCVLMNVANIEEDDGDEAGTCEN